MARQYVRQLRSSGEVVWSAEGDAAAKWAAITALSRIHEAVGRTRVALGADGERGTGGGGGGKAGGGGGRGRGGRVGGGAGGVEGAGAPHHELALEVLGLAEFGVHALEQFSRQEALASVHMNY